MCYGTHAVVVPTRYKPLLVCENSGSKYQTEQLSSAPGTRCAHCAGDWEPQGNVKSCDAFTEWCAQKPRWYKRAKQMGSKRGAPSAGKSRSGSGK